MVFPHIIILLFLPSAVSSVSARVWRTAIDVPSVIILSITLISFTQTFLVGILSKKVDVCLCLNTVLLGFIQLSLISKQFNNARAVIECSHLHVKSHLAYAL